MQHSLLCTCERIRPHSASNDDWSSIQYKAHLVEVLRKTAEHIFAKSKGNVYICYKYVT